MGTTSTRLAVLLSLALLTAVASGPARATTLAGGEHLNAGERAHEFYVGFPEIGYQWDFSATGQRTLGLQAGVLVWPFSVHLGLSTRHLLGVQGRTVVSLRFEPGMYLGLYGGSRGFYVNLRWGRSKSLDINLAPVINLGVSASIDVGREVSLILGFESPIALWMKMSPFGWWIEWPLLVDVGLEVDVSVRSTIFAKAAVGPVLGFTGANQFAGVSFGLMVGVQTNY